MVYLYLVRHFYIAMAHHIHGAPLVSIIAIAIFLVVFRASKRASLVKRKRNLIRMRTRRRMMVTPMSMPL